MFYLCLNEGWVVTDANYSIFVPGIRAWPTPVSQSWKDMLPMVPLLLLWQTAYPSQAMKFCRRYGQYVVNLVTLKSPGDMPWTMCCSCFTFYCTMGLGWLPSWDPQSHNVCYHRVSLLHCPWHWVHQYTLLQHVYKHYSNSLHPLQFTFVQHHGGITINIGLQGN